MDSALALRFAVGLALAGVYPLGMKLVVSWVPERAGAALAQLVGMLTLGTALPHGVRALGAGLDWQIVVLTSSALAIIGGLFVVETVSVMIQVASFKLTGKRVFRMAPLHHHYELKGWKETQVVVRFWIVTMMLVLAGLATLKLR